MNDDNCCSNSDLIEIDSSLLEIHEEDQPVQPKKRGRPPNKTKNLDDRPNFWTLDRNIMLVQKRIDLENYFGSCYNKSQAWKKLVRELNWDLDYRVAQSKFNNLVNYWKKKKPKTGEGAQMSYSLQQSNLIELITRYAADNHKYAPVNHIDTSSTQQKATPVRVIQQENEILDDLLATDRQNQEKENQSTNDTENYFSFSNDLDDLPPDELPEIESLIGDNSNSNLTLEPQASSSSSGTIRTRQTRKKPRTNFELQNLFLQEFVSISKSFRTIAESVSKINSQSPQEREIDRSTQSEM